MSIASRTSDQELTVHRVYLHDSVSYCVIRLWAHSDAYARRRAVETAGKYRGLELFDTIVATVTERNDAVFCQDDPHIIERGNR